MNIDVAVNYIDTFLSDYFDLGIPDITVTDIVEILIISYLSYKVLSWVRNTSAWMLMRGIIMITVFFIVAALSRMNTILWIGERLISVALIAMVVVFQPELRFALEHIGRNNLLSKMLPSFLRKNTTNRFNNKTRNDLVHASFDMSEVKTGALIVIEKDAALGEYVRTGIVLDSVISRQLLVNIFEKNTPLHDGAVIIRGDRVVAATCYLPLSNNQEINKELGTRHRAALGISEISDSLTIVVSEETGDVSVAEGGELKRYLDRESLSDILKDIQRIEEKEGGENA